MLQRTLLLQFALTAGMPCPPASRARAADRVRTRAGAKLAAIVAALPTRDPAAIPPDRIGAPKAPLGKVITFREIAERSGLESEA